MAKVMTSKSKKWISGGKGHMFGKQTVGTQVPGQSAQLGRGGGKFASGGGSGKMFGKQSSKSSKAQ